MEENYMSAREEECTHIHTQRPSNKPHSHSTHSRHRKVTGSTVALTSLSCSTYYNYYKLGISKETKSSYQKPLVCTSFEL
jgi:hypothetical protein